MLFGMHRQPLYSFCAAPVSSQSADTQNNYLVLTVMQPDNREQPFCIRPSDCIRSPAHCKLARLPVLQAVYQMPPMPVRFSQVSHRKNRYTYQSMDIVCFVSLPARTVQALYHTCPCSGNKALTAYGHPQNAPYRLSYHLND